MYDGDGDRNVGVCDGRLSFHSKYDDDDDAWRHEKKCSHKDLPVTVNDAAACSTAVYVITCHSIITDLNQSCFKGPQVRVRVLQFDMFLLFPS